MKKVELLFYTTPPAPDNTGLKLVLWEVSIEEGGKEPFVKHDWGFAYWGGQDWDMIATPEGVTAVVCRWANTVSPDLLLNEPSKIIKI